MLISWKLFKFRRNRTLFFESVFFKLLRLVVLVSFTSYTSLALTLWLKKSFSRRNHILNCILRSFMNGTTFLHKTYCHELIHFIFILMRLLYWGRFIDSYYLKVKLENEKDAKISVTLCRKQLCWKNLKIPLIFN